MYVKQVQLVYRFVICVATTKTRRNQNKLVSYRLIVESATKRINCTGGAFWSTLFDLMYTIYYFLI